MKHVVKDGRTFVCSSCPTPAECGTGCARIDRALDAAPAAPDPVPEVQRLALRPGDVVVLSYPDKLTAAQVDGMRRAWLAAMPGTKAVILEGGATVDTVLEAGTPEAQAATGGGA